MRSHSEAKTQGQPQQNSCISFTYYPENFVELGYYVRFLCINVNVNLQIFLCRNYIHSNLTFLKKKMSLKHTFDKICFLKNSIIRLDSEHFLSITNHLWTLSKGNKKMLLKELEIKVYCSIAIISLQPLESSFYLTAIVRYLWSNYYSKQRTIYTVYHQCKKV